LVTHSLVPVVDSVQKIETFLLKKADVLVKKQYFLQRIQINVHHVNKQTNKQTNTFKLSCTLYQTLETEEVEFFGSNTLFYCLDVSTRKST
jgi:hypothetical protein